MRQFLCGEGEAQEARIRDICGSAACDSFADAKVILCRWRSDIRFAVYTREANITRQRRISLHSNTSRRKANITEKSQVSRLGFFLARLAGFRRRPHAAPPRLFCFAAKMRAAISLCETTKNACRLLHSSIGRFESLHRKTKNHPVGWFFVLPCVDGKDAAQITFLLSNYSNNSSSYLSLTYSLTADVRLCISVSVGCSANSEIPSIDIVFR